MALDYRKCAQEITDVIGGAENIVSAAHCATRLRLVIVDNGKVSKKELENVDGVKGVFESNGQLQIIIGTGAVNKVYDEFLGINHIEAASKDEVKAAAAAKKPIWFRAIKSLGDVFVPILPAIVASGLLMGVVEALGKAIPGFADTGWYAFLDLVSNTAFAYLPVIVAISAARVFGGNLFLGAVTGLAMVHSGLINAWAVGGMAASEIPVWHLLFFNVKAVGYQGHVIPVIIAVWFMSTLEKWLHKHVPEVIDLFVTPLTTVLVTMFLTFTIIGPIFSTAESYILEFAKWVITVGHGIGAAIMGAIYPITVVFGLHHMYNVIEAGMLAEGGLNIWMPIASAANFAQFGACLAVAIKTKSQKNRAVALPSSLSASLGITEPAIFGINLRFMKPFICGMVGAACGAIFGSIMKLGATAYGVTGFPGFLTINNHLKYAILLAIAGGVAFVLTMVVWKGDDDQPDDEAKAEKKAAKAAKKAAKKNGGDVAAAVAAPAAAAAAALRDAADMPKVMGTEAGEVGAPTKGKVIPYTEITDETFASGVLGEGVGIVPEEGVVYAPYDGTISSVADTQHAVGITGAGDMELLIHVGVDTVKMNGDGFKAFVKEGDEVKKGQKLIEFDRDKIKDAGYADTVVVLLTNSDDYNEFAPEA